MILFELGLSSESLPFFAIALNLWITGGLHHDGLMDTADGISAGPIRCLEAMKDSRVGASGVVALMINIAIQIAALKNMNTYYFIILPVCYFWGRYSHLLAIGNYLYIQNNGSSEFHKSNWNGNLKESIPSIICLILCITIVFQLDLLPYLKIFFLLINFLGFFISIIIPKLLSNKLGGHCGDSYGASIILVETSTLFISSIIFPASL